MGTNKLKEPVRIYDIVKDYLMKNGFDGLGNDEDDCTCSIEDMPMCGNISDICIPVYLHNNPATCPPDCGHRCFEGFGEGGFYPSQYCGFKRVTEAL